MTKISKYLIEKSQKISYKNLKISHEKSQKNLIQKINFQKSKNFDDYFFKRFFGMKRFISSKNTLRDTREDGDE